MANGDEILVVDIASGTTFTPFEVEFRGDIHKIKLELDWKEGDTEPSYAEFARQIAGLFDLPSVWAVTSMRVGLSEGAGAAEGYPAAPPLPAPADAPAFISNDADLLAVLSIADQRAVAGEPPMRLKLERFGLGLTDSIAAFGAQPSASLSDRARGVRIAKAKRNQQHQQHQQQQQQQQQLVAGGQAAAPFFDPRSQTNVYAVYGNGGLQHGPGSPGAVKRPQRFP